MKWRLGHENGGHWFPACGDVCHSADPLLLLTGVRPRRLWRTRREVTESSTHPNGCPIRGTGFGGVFPVTSRDHRVTPLSARDLGGVLAHVRAAAVGVVEPALGQHHPGPRGALAAPRGAELAHRERLVRVELGEQLVERGERVDQGQGVAQRATRARTP